MDANRSDDARLTLRLPARGETPAAARKALASLNGDLHLISEARLEDAQLLLTELVSNNLPGPPADRAGRLGVTDRRADLAPVGR